MSPNPTKCGELIINSLQFQQAPFGELKLMGSAVKRVNSYKIVGVHVSDDLTWNTHMDYLFKKVNKRLYELRILNKSGLGVDYLVKIFCTGPYSSMRPLCGLHCRSTLTMSSSQYKQKLCALCSLI